MNHPSGAPYPADALVGFQLFQLCNEFWSRVDRMTPGSAADMFLPDGRLTLGPVLTEGREAIRAFLLERDARELSAGRSTCHVTSNYRLLSCEGGRAVVSSMVAVYAAIGELPQPSALPSTMGGCEDELVQGQDGRWLFASRRTVRIFFVGSAPPSFLQQPKA
jgi:SnoaL-like domain